LIVEIDNVYLVLGLDFHLILFPQLVSKVLLEVGCKIYGHLGHARVQSGHEAGVEREQVDPAALDVEKGPEDT
jgi:hypothetical protein